MSKLVEGIDYTIDVSADGKTVWVHSSDGSCVGRFSKTFGLDVHRDMTDQIAGAGQCIYCTHSPAGAREWLDFCEKIKEHHSIVVSPLLVSF